MGDLTEIADQGRLGQGRSGGAAEVLRTMTASGSRRRSTSTRSTGCGSTRRCIDKIGGTEPKTFDELIALLDKVKAAGVIAARASAARPGRTRRCSTRSCCRPAGPSSTRRPMIDLDEEALEVRHDEEVVRQPGQAHAPMSTRTSPAATGTSPPPWSSRARPACRSWATGPRANSSSRPRRRRARTSSAIRFPGTDGSVTFNSDMFGMFNVPDDRKAAQVALATATLSKSFQSAFNVVKGSVPARTDVPDTDFDACGKKGIADLKAANEGGTLFGSLAQGYGAPRRSPTPTRTSSSKFVHGQIKTSDEAVEAARQGDRRRQVSAVTTEAFPAAAEAPATGRSCAMTVARRPVEGGDDSHEHGCDHQIDADAGARRRGASMRSRLQDALPKIVLAPSFVDHASSSSTASSCGRSICPSPTPRPSRPMR